MEKPVGGLCISYILYLRPDFRFYHLKFSFYLLRNHLLRSEPLFCIIIYNGIIRKREI